MKVIAIHLLAILLLAYASFACASAADLNLLATPKSFSAKFIETRTLPGFDQPLVSHGQLNFSRGTGVIWEVTSPYHYVFKMDPSGVEEQMPDGSVRHMDPRQEPWLGAVRQIFTSALSGDTSGLERYFDVQVTVLKDSRRIELDPKPGPVAKAIKHISVVEAGTPQSLRIDEASGGRIEIRFFDTRAVQGAP
ncbi:MAG: outer membrane lipoprotein carrier protein LolA [Gammaproteobacteria bacterium]